MHYFCTLFDSNFLSRGLSLYDSLIKSNISFLLYIYCFDDLSYEVLKKLALANALPVGMGEFESTELLAIKPSRSIGEYCWTCTPHVIKHSIQTFGLPAVTYIDADLYFFDSPSALLDEWDQAGASVLITEHRYTKSFDHSNRFGIYCVQFIAFRNNEYGARVLDWWCERCIDWCFDREEEGKFGDQKYLDDWPTRFSSVHILRHLGGGVAPWNVQQYKVHTTDGLRTRLLEKTTMIDFPLVFYHFHGLQIFEDGEIDMATYPLGKEIKNVIYEPYLKALRKSSDMLKQVCETTNFHGLRKRPQGFFEKIRGFKRRVFRRFSGALNIVKVNDLQSLK